jgi:hypothetical protein
VLRDEWTINVQRVFREYFGWFYMSYRGFAVYGWYGAMTVCERVWAVVAVFVWTVGAAGVLVLEVRQLGPVTVWNENNVECFATVGVAAKVGFLFDS